MPYNLFLKSRYDPVKIVNIFYMTGHYGLRHLFKELRTWFEYQDENNNWTVLKYVKPDDQKNRKQCIELMSRFLNSSGYKYAIDKVADVRNRYPTLNQARTEISKLIADAAKENNIRLSDLEIPVKQTETVCSTTLSTAWPTFSGVVKKTKEVISKFNVLHCVFKFDFPVDQVTMFF